ncbi:acyltransferase family protein [Peribacillus sp. SCS-155]|uniref:acyltransferase family protein n=1 Tax=Peribacillus sedimenti TaxID=3115297 RepID=UPI003905DFAA
MDQRFRQLDSLRGLAAITVMMSHFFEIFPIFIANTYAENTSINILKYSPVHIIYAGHEAVIFFFILSGFVLSLPFYSQRQPDYPVYVTKRIFRIYVPYVVSVIIAVILNLSISGNGINGLSDWINSVWSLPVDWVTFFGHILFIGSFDNAEFNPVYWSLVHEMRISLVFPLLMLCLMRYKEVRNLAVWIPLSFFGFVATVLLAKIGIEIDYFATFSYIIMFLLGAILAKNKDILIKKYSSLSLISKVLLSIISLLAYTSFWTFQNVRIINYSIINDYFIAAGVFIIVIMSLAPGNLSRFLLLRPVQFLGKVSYSLYLYHSLVLFSLVYLLHNKFNWISILSFSFVGTIIVSSFAYYLVEKPAIKFGKRVSILIENRKHSQLKRVV